MNSVYINAKQLIAHLFATGGLTMHEVREALQEAQNGAARTNYPNGYCPTGRGSTCSTFIATAREGNEQGLRPGSAIRDRNGLVRLNIRDSKR